MLQAFPKRINLSETALAICAIATIAIVAMFKLGIQGGAKDIALALGGTLGGFLAKTGLDAVKGYLQQMRDFNALMAQGIAAQKDPAKIPDAPAEPEAK